MAGNGGQASRRGAAEKWSEPGRKHSLDSVAEPEGFAAGPGMVRPTTVSLSQTYSNLMYMKRSHNQESRSMISMLGKANPNQEAKFTMSLLSGNNLRGEAPVRPPLHQMLGRERGQARPSGQRLSYSRAPRAGLKQGPQNIATHKTCLRCDQPTLLGVQPAEKLVKSKALQSRRIHLCTHITGQQSRGSMDSSESPCGCGLSQEKGPLKRSNLKSFPGWDQTMFPGG